MRLAANVLPTVIVVSVLILTAMLGLLGLWEQQSLLFARANRLRQAHADVQSACTLYRLHPEEEALFAPEGYLLDDSVPQSRVFIHQEPWGLYNAVHIRTADSLLRICRLFGTKPDADTILFYADNRSAVTLAGQTLLQGFLCLPQNGLVYGRVGSDFYRGTEIPRTAIRQSEAALPLPSSDPAIRITTLFAGAATLSDSSLPDSLSISFSADTTTVFRLSEAEIADCGLRGKIILYADELRIDSTCRIENLLICARKITLASGANISAQLFAGDTVIVEPRAILRPPSGIYAEQYAEVSEHAEINGYVIVRDTTERKSMSVNYRQSRTARVRGLVYVEGVAQIQGIVSGRAVVRQAAYFSPQGYYRDMLYDLTLLANPETVQPFWLPAAQRKEAAWVN